MQRCAFNGKISSPRRGKTACTDIISCSLKPTEPAPVQKLTDRTTLTGVSSGDSFPPYFDPTVRALALDKEIFLARGSLLLNYTTNWSGKILLERNAVMYSDENAAGFVKRIDFVGDIRRATFLGRFRRCDSVITTSESQPLNVVNYLFNDLMKYECKERTVGLKIKVSSVGISEMT